MNPLLRTPKHLAVMGILWVPICLWVVYLVHALADAPYRQAVLLSVPPMLVELIASLGLWYACKVISLNRNNWFRLLYLHIIPAVLVNALWLTLVFLYSLLLDQLLAVSDYSLLYMEAFPVFLAVGVSLYCIAVPAHYLVSALESNRRSKQEALEQKIIAGRAELNAIKATVHPHFLFNCLNMLGPLMNRSTDKAQTVVSQLSEFLLHSLRHGKKELTTVGEELAHVENYLAIESVRLGHRLETDIQLEEGVADVPMLSLLLLPFVENAVKHGIGQCLEGGTVRVAVKSELDAVAVDITNPYEEPSRPLAGEGMGIRTMRRRLMTFYESGAGLKIAKESDIFTVKIWFPKELKDNDARE